METVRSKIVLIKGWAKLAPRITLGEYERINADYVALITALKYPSTLPDEYSAFESDPTTMYTDIKRILNNWAINEQEYMLAAEYANIVTGRNNHEIKAVEGVSLEVDWWYDTVRNYHRHFGQTVIDTEVIYHSEAPGGLRLLMHGKEMLIEDAVDALRPYPFLG